MGGKSGTTTSSVAIPKEVLARYNAVNAKAEQVAQTPFQPYTGQFVAPITQTQQSGINATNQYAQAAQPYYSAATGQLLSAQQGAFPGMSAAYGNVGQAQNVGTQLGSNAYQLYGGAMGAAAPYYNAMTQGIGGALGYAQPLNAAAQTAAAAAPEMAAPFYNVASQGTAASLAAAQPYQQAAGMGLGRALDYTQGINAVSPAMAINAYNYSQPVMGQALAGTQFATEFGRPFLESSSMAALLGAQGVNPQNLNVGAYMNPYTQAVADTTFQALRQQQQQEMQGATGNAIRSGAFGGDRSGLVAANLARQQQLGTAQAMAPIYQQGFGQALQTAQQQQGVQLSAEQANRAALQNLSQQLQGLGQQAYGQQLGAAGQMGQLGQNIYGQGIGAAQALSQLGQTGFGQQLAAAQQAAALGQQAYGQQLGAAQQFGQLGQNIYGMGANQANLLSQLGQTGYGQQLGAAQQYGNVGQNIYQMGLGSGQAIQGLGQQQFGQGMSAAQQLAALAQQGYGMGAATSQALAGLGTGAQQAALQGAQAQIGAGTLQQQTQQADLTAKYQQFLQERGYPFQVAQFLANIAMGTGALSGSTTTTTQPMPFFSDRRVKHDVKEIGETHDGQPIYSFKYNGDDRTQIGLMAQDVEKKHPEAVYDIDGIKGVDYEEATRDAARPEKYAGGLVPSSMGGAVNQPGAYNRGGYTPGGSVGLIVDPNDINSILAAQAESMGPFAEGGIYGMSQHQPPFMQEKGIVPTKRLHTPKLLQAGAPPPMPEGMGAQTLNAFDQTMAMKGRYEKAKEFLRGKETPQEEMDRTRHGQIGADRSNLAGPDIISDKKPDEDKGVLGTLASFFGYAEGGVIPRQHYAIGGSKDPSLPYEEDDKSPYKYFPTEILETEKPELAKASQTPAPTSQTGIGLGTLLGLFFNQGGVVPRGRLQTGGVYDPTMGRVVSTAMSPIEELEKEDIYSRELQPAAAPRFRVFERLAAEEGAKGVKPTELYRSPERSAMLDLTMPAGAPRAKPYQSGHNYRLAVDYSGTTPENYDAIRKAAAATGLTSGLDFRNVDPPHVQLGKGGYGGLYGKDVVIDEGFGQRSQSGVVPVEAQQAAYDAARASRPDLPARGATPAAGRSEGVMPRLQNYFAENQGWLVPLGAGLRGMFQSKSPFLGAAIGEGVGTGLEAIGASQANLANIGLTKAQQSQALSNIDINKLIGTIDPATGQITYRLRTDMLGGSLAPNKLEEQQQKAIEEAEQAVSGEAPKPVEKPVAAPIAGRVENGTYRFEVAPTPSAAKKFSAYGYEGKPGDGVKVQANLAMYPQLLEQQQTDLKLFNDRKELAKNTPMMRQDLNMLTDAVFGISKSGLTSVGPGQESRARAVALFNWAVDNAGLDEAKINVGSDISDAQIIEKLRTSAGINKAGPAGFRAASLAEAINDAQPSGSLDEKASRKLMSSMYVQNQFPEDFTKYGDKYSGEFGGLLYADNSFKEDVGQRYEAEKRAMFDALEPMLMPDGSYKSRAQWLRENPSRALEFENHYKIPGLARLVLGG